MSPPCQSRIPVQGLSQTKAPARTSRTPRRILPSCNNSCRADTEDTESARSHKLSHLFRLSLPLRRRLLPRHFHPSPAALVPVPAGGCCASPFLFSAARADRIRCARSQPASHTSDNRSLRRAGTSPAHESCLRSENILLRICG